MTVHIYSERTASTGLKRFSSPFTAAPATNDTDPDDMLCAYAERTSTIAASLGNLRNVSCRTRTWSESAADLSKSSSSTGLINPAFQDKVQQYWTPSGSSANIARPITPLFTLSSRVALLHAIRSQQSKQPISLFHPFTAEDSGVHMQSTPSPRNSPPTSPASISSPKGKRSSASEREHDAHNTRDRRPPPSHGAFHFGLAAKSAAAELGSANHGLFKVALVMQRGESSTQATHGINRNDNSASSSTSVPSNDGITC